MEAGGERRPIEDQRIKLISNLTGEMYTNDHDPQEHTDIQRAWLYSKDPGVKTINSRPEGPHGPPRDLKLALQPFDNANSLPLGEGMWPSHPKSRGQSGFYRRIRTDVTITKNNIITRK